MNHSNENEQVIICDFNRQQKEHNEEYFGQSTFLYTRKAAANKTRCHVT